jgi:hypothetical protein
MSGIGGAIAVMVVGRQQIEKHWTVDYTCGCGLYVHPENKLYNPQACHCTGCEFDQRKNV